MGYFVPYNVYSGQKNMQIDSDILEFAISKKINYPIFRLYGWNPSCVSLGRNQNDNHIDKDYCQLNNIDIVRRLTGGRGLLHDDELTYSFVCPVSYLKSGEKVVESYKEISGAIATGLKLCNIIAEFSTEKKTDIKYEYCMSLSTGADLCYEGKKIVGSAQFRKQGYILQHGSIIFSLNNEQIEKIFKEEPNSSHIATIKSTLPNLSKKTMCECLKKGVEKYFAIQLSSQNEEFWHL